MDRRTTERTRSQWGSVLTADEAAAALRLSTRQLAEMRYRGNGPAFVKLSHKSVGYTEASLAEWIATRTRTITGE